MAQFFWAANGGVGQQDPWTQLDGRLQAPAGPAQFPTLLNGYPTASPPNSRIRWSSASPNGNGCQPPWMVAGVDYAVGPTAGTVFKDPSSNTVLGGSLVLSVNAGSGNNQLTFSSVPSWVQTGMHAFDLTQLTLPFGTTVLSIASNVVTVSNNTTSFLNSGSEISFTHFQGMYPQSDLFTVWIYDSNTTVDGWDFGLNNGWVLRDNAASGTIIQNCHFKVGSNTTTNGGAQNTGCMAIGSANALIWKNELDGNGFSAGSTADILIDIGSTGTSKFWYNYIHDGWGIGIRTGASSGGETWDFRYNYIANTGEGQSAGAHGDWEQSFNTTGINNNGLVFNFNTWFQMTSVSGSATQGISAYSESGTVSGFTHTVNVENNTMITQTGSDVNFAILIDTSRVINTGTCKQNYIDISGIQVNWSDIGNLNSGGQSGVVTISGNVSMTNGAALT